LQFKARPGQTVHENLSRKNPSQKKKKAGGVAQAVRTPAYKCTVLCSNPSAAKIKKKSPEYANPKGQKAGLQLPSMGSVWRGKNVLELGNSGSCTAL
jgi:hypothetical protein